MAENRFKIRICRILRSPLSSCKSKDQISDVVQTNQSGQHYQLVELFSPQPPPFTTAEETYFINTSKLPLLSPNVDGRKCPPASPIISPLNTTFYGVPKEKKKSLNKKKGRSTAYKKKNKYSGFAHEFPECRYNGLFSSDEDEEQENEKTTLFPWRSSITPTGRRVAVEDSLAVVKRSSDPYSDFRTSMVEMIVEKEIFATKDLQNLLQCFLSLNSYHHHKVIIQVFGEIYQALLS